MALTSPVDSSIRAITQQKRTLESLIPQPRMREQALKLILDMQRALTKDQRDLRLTDDGIQFMIEMYDYLDMTFSFLQSQTDTTQAQRRIEVGKQSLRRVLHALRMRLDLETALYWAQAVETCKPLFDKALAAIPGVADFRILYRKVEQKVQAANIRPFERGVSSDRYTFGFGRQKSAKLMRAPTGLTERPLPGTDPRDTGPWRNRVLRVYVSASRSDMALELRELHTTVLPQFRNACAERGVALVEIDFQTASSSGGSSWTSDDDELGTRLAEVDKADVFIGLIGSEYGRVLKEPVSTEMRVRFPWLKPFTKEDVKVSVQELELTSAVLRPGAGVESPLLYFRDPSFKPLTPAARAHEDHAASLRQRLLEHDAECTVHLDTRAAPSCARLILQDLMNVLDSIFPRGVTPTRLWWQRSAHDAMGTRLTRMVVDRSYERQMLERLVFHPPQSQPVCVPADSPEIMGYAARPNIPICIVGQAGVGKSTLVSQAILDYADRYGSTGLVTLLVHFVETSTEYLSTTETVRRLTSELITSCCLQRETAFTNDQVLSEFRQVVKEAAESVKGKLVLVIDGLDHLDPGEDDASLAWLDFTLPKNVTMVVTCTQATPAFKELKRLSLPLIHLDNLSNDQRQECIARYLAMHGKRLTKDTINYLCRYEHTKNPFLLTMILARISSLAIGQDLASTVKEACAQMNIATMLENWVDGIEDGLVAKDRAPLAREVLSALAVARGGLFENELRELVRGDAFGLSPLLRAFSPLLIEAGGLVHICSQRFREFVFAKYDLRKKKSVLSSPRQATTHKHSISELHGKLGVYFSTRSVTSPLGHLNLRRAVFHLVEGYRLAELQRVVLQPQRMHILCDELSMHEAYRAYTSVGQSVRPNKPGSSVESLKAVNDIFETALRALERNSKKAALSTHSQNSGSGKAETPTATSPIALTEYFLSYGHFLVHLGLRERGLYWIQRAIRFLADPTVRKDYIHLLLDALQCMSWHITPAGRSRSMKKSTTVTHILRKRSPALQMRTVAQAEAAEANPVRRDDSFFGGASAQGSTATRLGVVGAAPTSKSENDLARDESSTASLPLTEDSLARFNSHLEEGESRSDKDTGAADAVVEESAPVPVKPKKALKRSSSTPNVGGKNVLRRVKSKLRGLGGMTHSVSGFISAPKRNLSAMPDLKAMDRGEFIDALIANCDDHLEPDHWRRAAIHLRIAIDYESQGRFDKAEAEIESASQESSSIPDWHPVRIHIDSVCARFRQRRNELPHEPSLQVL